MSFFLLGQKTRIQFMVSVNTSKRASRASPAHVESLKHVLVLRARKCTADSQSSHTTRVNPDNLSRAMEPETLNGAQRTALLSNRRIKRVQGCVLHSFTNRAKMLRGERKP